MMSAGSLPSPSEAQTPQGQDLLPLLPGETLQQHLDRLTALHAQLPELERVAEAAALGCRQARLAGVKLQRYSDLIRSESERPEPELPGTLRIQTSAARPSPMPLLDWARQRTGPFTVPEAAQACRRSEFDTWMQLRDLERSGRLRTLAGTDEPGRTWTLVAVHPDPLRPPGVPLRPASVQPQGTAAERLLTWIRGRNSQPFSASDLVPDLYSTQKVAAQLLRVQVVAGHLQVIAGRGITGDTFVYQERTPSAEPVLLSVPIGPGPDDTSDPGSSSPLSPETAPPPDVVPDLTDLHPHADPGGPPLEEEPPLTVQDTATPPAVTRLPPEVPLPAEDQNPPPSPDPAVDPATAPTDPPASPAPRTGPRQARALPQPRVVLARLRTLRKRQPQLSAEAAAEQLKVPLSLVLLVLPFCSPTSASAPANAPARRPALPPFPDRLSHDGCQVFGLLRHEPEGLTDRLLAARLSWSTQRVRQCLTELQLHQHVRLNGERYLIRPTS